MRVVESAESHDLSFEVLYPVDWEKNVFEIRTIVFRDVLNYRVDEGPFLGAPTLLDAYEEGVNGSYRRVTLQTNAGTRSLCFKTVELLDRMGMTWKVFSDHRAIDYPNSRPHIGTAFEKIGGDVQAILAADAATRSWRRLPAHGQRRELHR